MNLMVQKFLPFSIVYDLKDTSRINSILSRDDVKALIPRDTRFVWAVKELEIREDYNDTPGLLELQVIRVPRNGKAPLEGDVITDARADFDKGKPMVSMAMNSKGAKEWKKTYRC